MSCDEQEDSTEDIRFMVKGAEQVKKEANKDGAGACKIVSVRLSTVLRLVLIGPPYRTTSSSRGKTWVECFFCPKFLAYSRTVDELTGILGQRFQQSEVIRSCNCFACG